MKLISKTLLVSFVTKDFLLRSFELQSLKETTFSTLKQIIVDCALFYFLNFIYDLHKYFKQNKYKNNTSERYNSRKQQKSKIPNKIKNRYTNVLWKYVKKYKDRHVMSGTVSSLKMGTNLVVI